MPTPQGEKSSKIAANYCHGEAKGGNEAMRGRKKKEVKGHNLLVEFSQENVQALQLLE